MILHVKRLTSGAEDAHGNSEGTLGDPEAWEVYGLAPGAQREPSSPNRDLSEIAWTVYAPATADAPTGRDLVVVDGEDFEVNGDPQDWTRGPWPHPTAGLVVELVRTEG